MWLPNINSLLGWWQIGTDIMEGRVLPLSSGYAVDYCQCPQDMQCITAIVLRICSGLLHMQWITAIVLGICSGLLPMSSGYAVYYCHCPQDMQWITAYAVDYCQCPQYMQCITAIVLRICSGLLWNSTCLLNCTVPRECLVIIPVPVMSRSSPHLTG